MSALTEGALRVDPLLDDPEGVHAEAIAALPQLDPQRRAAIHALTRSADPFTEALRSTLRGDVA